MKVLLIISFIIGLASHARGQLPLHYKLKKIAGTIYDEHGVAVHVRMVSRKDLRIGNCRDPELKAFLHTLMLGRRGRIALQYLLTTNGKITVICSEKLGLIRQDGKYYLMAGITGPEEHQSRDLIEDDRPLSQRAFQKHASAWVHEENTIEFFKGSVHYGNDPSSIVLDPANIKLVDHASSKEIREFSMDTISIEPIQWPEFLYKNMAEFYYFCGIHEIHHTRPENVEIRLNHGDAEVDAHAEEMKAFKKRRVINKRYARSLIRNGEDTAAGPWK